MPGRFTASVTAHSSLIDGRDLHPLTFSRASRPTEAGLSGAVGANGDYFSNGHKMTRHTPFSASDELRAEEIELYVALSHAAQVAFNMGLVDFAERLITLAYEAADEGASSDWAPSRACSRNPGRVRAAPPDKAETN